MGHSGEVLGTSSDGHRMDEKARKELLDKMIKLRETEKKTKDDECKDSSTLKRKIDNQMIKNKGGRISLRLVI